MNELENYWQIFLNFLEEADDELHTIQLTRNNSFTWKVRFENDKIIGVDVNNLGNEPFLKNEVFYESIKLLIESPEYKAPYGNSIACKLGEPELGLQTIEGHVASRVYGKIEGRFILRRITPIKYLLREANICSFDRGYLRLNQEIIFDIYENKVEKELDTQDFENEYDLMEHKHRFACWAASRAASVINYRFRVEQGKAILDAIRNEEFPKQLNALKFDEFHKKLRVEIIQNAKSMYNLNWSHGVAAKLLNIYHKTIFVCDGNVSNDIVRFIHPPIDSILLDALSRNFDGEMRENFNIARQIRWSNFDSDQYDNVINSIRIVVRDNPLWTIERFWRGYQ